MFSLETRLRNRLLWGVLLVSIVLGVTVRMKVHQEQSKLLNYQLEQVARALILSDLQGTVQTWDSDPALHLDVQIWDADGMLLYRSSDLIDVDLDTSPGLSAVRSGHQSDAVKLKVFTLSNGQRTVQVMHAQGLRDALHMDAELEVLIPAMLVMLVGAILVTMTIRKELEPIRELDDELGRRDAGSLQPVSLANAPMELASVVTTLNTLLQQLDTSLQAHKRFIANAAHELRTPITALSLEADNLLRDQDPAHMLATAARLKLGTQRAQHLLQQMLTLARLEARTQPRPRVTVDLQQLAQQSMMDLSALASHRGVEFELDIDGQAMVQGDPDDLRLLLDNLLGNALKFSPPNMVVTMTLTRQGSEVTLLLRDHGPGIGPELRERMLLPFVRVDAAIEGAGLGLSIVQEVVLNHGATLSLETPSEGQGLLVRLSFPMST
ncbi:HAMP domain-containing sensor histidine kinase [Rhodoferax sp. PAMC 29310]|uniref:sensor histidine kinase n=1 Tax=Rhodoferax sp. PAMC 29310 TaxID=2822760 RepID=UPI001B33C80A|nr:HAMP domain-containing sensor histidine kinase [Rhodoferax sp. PAMC 29310]